MNTRNAKLVAAFSYLKEIQDDGRKVFRSVELNKHRVVLLRGGFLKELLKGWYIFSPLGDNAGETTIWNATWRDFISVYCEHRFRSDWHLSPEQSLLLHARNTVAPKQIIVYAKSGQNNTIELKNGASIFDYKVLGLKSEYTMVLDGVRVLTPEAALIQASENFFKKHQMDAQIILETISDVSLILEILLDGGKSAAAGRIAGALRTLGKVDEADSIVEEMRTNGYTIVETNPFETYDIQLLRTYRETPFEQRIRLMWNSMREDVISVFPPEPGIPQTPDGYLKVIRDLYARDAYHSLSIEGYRVTEGLIKRIQEGVWNPDDNPRGLEAKSAFAAKGYQFAFESVQESVAKILAGENSADVVRGDHQKWYSNLFRPSITAGILETKHLRGYRNDAVYIRDSFHVPPSPTDVRNGMHTFFELLKDEPSAAVRAVLGHFMLVFIHPYMDGNGRIGRFILNALFASGGYDWTIIPVEKRQGYLETLETASVQKQIRPFAEFIAKCMEQNNP